MSFAAFTQQSLPAVVRNLRNAPGGTEEEAVDKYIADTKLEVNSADARIKIAAIQKATYFHMIGYSSLYADFRVVEMMASPLFLHKRVAYLAACLTFTEDTDVLPLMTASLKRDLRSSNPFEVGLALYCIASICTPDMAQDVVADVANLLSHPRAYVRKKATLSLYRIFLSYPESLRLTYGQLKQKLEDHHEKADTDAAVRGAVVCVLCELARRNPANFLGLAVPFYALLSSVHSNWTLIKVVKVFGYFAPLEPRLGKKLVEPIANLIKTTGAKSVEFECLLAVAKGMSNAPSLIKLASERIRGFVEDADPNLRFLGLEALSLLVVSSDNRKLLASQRDAVLRCLDDPDSTIRLKALGVLRDLTTRKTAVTHINAMLDRCVRTPPDEAWTNAVVLTIIRTAQSLDYEWIDDFEWYLSVLLDLCVVEVACYAHGAVMERELVCILSRVNGVRRIGVEEMSTLLTNARLLGCRGAHSTQWRVLCAAAFVCGEYPHWLPDVLDTCRALLSDAVTRLPAEVQRACVVAVGKIVAYVYQPSPRHVELCKGEEDCEAPVEARPTPPSLEVVTQLLLPMEDDERHTSANGADVSAAVTRGHRGLKRFFHSVFPNVVERAHLVQHQLLDHPEVGPSLYSAELPPVAAGAQDAIELPADLDLDAPFCENVSALMALSDSDGEGHDFGDGASAYGYEEGDGTGSNFNLAYRMEQQRRREEARREEVAAYYLQDTVGPESDLLASSSSVPRSAHHIGRNSEAHHHTDALTRPGERTRPHLPRKVHDINRQLSKPLHYKEQQTAHRRRSHTPEEDEATRKLRGIDITRALRADERLPETLSYAQLLQQPQHSERSRAAPLSGTVPPPPPPLTLHDGRPLRLHLMVRSCKVRRDGFYLSCSVECVNTTSSSTVHDLRLAVTTSAAFDTGTLSLRHGRSKPHEAGEEEEKDEEGKGRGSSVVLADKLKGAAALQVLIGVHLAHLPSSFKEAPVPLRISWMAERKRTEVDAEFPLEYVYFTKTVLPSAVLTSQEYLEDVLANALAVTPIASAFVPCSKAKIMMGVTAAMPELRLSPIDVFKDALSMYGVLHGRKSELSRTHVAMLLQEQEVGGVKGVSISVRCHYPALSEALILKMVALLEAS